MAEDEGNMTQDVLMLRERGKLPPSSNVAYFGRFTKRDCTKSK